MNGYIYNKETRVITTKINNVVACNDITIKGESLAVLGTGEYVITDSEYDEGDILPDDAVDKRAEVEILSAQ